MKHLVAMLVALSCSVASAQEWIARPAPIGHCRTYSVPVANYYRIIRDPYTGYIYSREYIGTRYEQRTYCSPRGRYGFEPWWNDSDRWAIDTGFGEYR